MFFYFNLKVFTDVLLPAPPARHRTAEQKIKIDVLSLFVI